MISLLKSRLLEQIEKALNAYLALDPDSKKRLTHLNHKTLRLEFRGLDQVMHCRFTTAGVQLISPLQTKPDVIIIGTPLSLVHLTLAKNRHRFFTEDVLIQGNLELGQQMMDLLDQLDIDWAEYASHFIGDFPAHHLSRFLQGIKQRGKKTVEQLRQDVSEFVQEEIAVTPSREALQDFFQQVDLLRMDADRVDWRVQQLLKRVEGQKK